MSDENGTEKHGRSLLDEIRQMRIDADKGREPELLTNRFGTRRFSINALMEHIIDQFVAEHGGGSVALHDATTEAKRLKLILGTTDYVLAVESVQVSDKEKADIIRRVYNELFTYGPLDELFADDSITTITLEGSEKVAVRYGHAELKPLNPIFEDESHVRRIIKRLLLDSGAELSPEFPIIEAGLIVNGRHVCISIAGPPVTYEISADIRIHPANAVSLQDHVESGFMTLQALEIIRAIADSPHGIAIVGDTESGKTTLLSAVAAHIAAHNTICAVERAGEMHLPDTAHRLVVQWPMQDREGISFGGQVEAALQTGASVILVDEVRTDEAPAIYSLLSGEDVPRQLWTFRGPVNTKRLTSALSMLARRSAEDSALREDLVRALYRRLPFVITLRRRRSQIQLHSISEWQFSEGAEYPDLVELMTMRWETLEMTGRIPLLKLGLPESFWG